jgi:hypothetical protein
MKREASTHSLRISRGLLLRMQFQELHECNELLEGELQ